MCERVVLRLDRPSEAEEVFGLVRSVLTPMPIVFPLIVVNPAVVTAACLAPRSQGRYWYRRLHAMTFLKDAVSLNDWEGMRYQCVVKGRFSAARGIVEFASEWRSDPIALTSRGRNCLSRLMPGSVADEVVRLSPVKGLILTENEMALAS